MSERERRRQILNSIRDYYDIEVNNDGAAAAASDGAAAAAAAPTGRATSVEAPAGTASSGEYDMDSKNFSASRYITRLLRDKSLDHVISTDELLRKQVKALDKQLQNTVYNNYTHFIAATDTITEVRRSIDDMDKSLGHLSANVEQMETLSKTIDEGLLRHRQQIREMLEVNQVFRSIQVLVQLPDAIQSAVDRRQYQEAVRLWVLGDRIFSKHANIASFQKTQLECRQAAEQLHDELTAWLSTCDVANNPECCERARATVKALQQLQSTSIDKNKLQCPFRGDEGAFLQSIAQLLLTGPLARFKQASVAVDNSIADNVELREEVMQRLVKAAVAGEARGEQQATAAPGADASGVASALDGIEKLSMISVTDAVRAACLGARTAIERVADITKEVLNAEVLSRKLADVETNLSAAIVQVQLLFRPHFPELDHILPAVEGNNLLYCQVVTAIGSRATAANRTAALNALLKPEVASMVLDGAASSKGVDIAPGDLQAALLLCSKASELSGQRVSLHGRIATVSAENQRLSTTLGPFMQQAFDAASSKLLAWTARMMTSLAVVLPSIVAAAPRSAGAAGGTATGGSTALAAVDMFVHATVKGVYELAKGFSLIANDFLKSNPAALTTVLRRAEELPLRAVADLVSVMETFKGPDSAAASAAAVAMVTALPGAIYPAAAATSSSGKSSKLSPEIFVPLGVGACARALRRSGLKQLESYHLLSRDTSVLKGSLDNLAKSLCHAFIRAASSEIAERMRTEWYHRSDWNPHVTAAGAGASGGSAVVATVTKATVAVVSLVAVSWDALNRFVAAVVPKEPDPDDIGARVVRSGGAGSTTGSTISRAAPAGGTAASRNSGSTAVGPTTIPLVASVTRSDRSSGSTGGGGALLGVDRILNRSKAPTISLRPSVVDVAHVIEAITMFAFKDVVEQIRSGVFSKVSLQQLQVDTSVLLHGIAQGSQNGWYRREERIVGLVHEMVACAYERCVERSPLTSSIVERIAKDSIDAMIAESAGATSAPPAAAPAAA